MTTQEKFQAIVGTPFYFPPVDGMIKVDDHHAIHIIDRDGNSVDSTSGDAPLSVAVIDRFYNYSEQYKQAQREAGVPEWSI